GPVVTQLEPAMQAESPQESAARDIRTIAVEAAQQLVQQHIDALRAELEEMIHQAAGTGLEATDSQVEETARRIAQESAQKAVEHFGEGLGPAAPEKIKAELRRDLRGHMAE